MYTYEANEIMSMCARDRQMVSGLARKAGILTQAIGKAGSSVTTQNIAGMASEAVSNKPLYSVTLTRALADHTLQHEVILITPNGGEALQRRNELNKTRVFEGSKEVAQVNRREVLPRQWKLWHQVSPSEVHLRCEWTKARALLRTPTPELLKDLHDGKALPQGRFVYLQSEQVELTMESVSTRPVTFAKNGAPAVTQNAEIRTPVICRLDVNSSSELVTDTQCGVMARHPFKEDKLTLPERFAKSLWQEGIVLPLQIVTGGKVLVRLTDVELRTRLELSRFQPAVRRPATFSTRRICYRSKELAPAK
jgi:hypothetical protein